MPRAPKIANDPGDQTAGTLTPGGGSGTFDGMEARVSKLESDMTEIKVMFGRLDERLTAINNTISSSLATKTDVAEMMLATRTDVAGIMLATKTDVAEIKGELRGKLGFWQFLSVVVAIGALMVKWPEIFRIFGGS